MVKPVYVFDRAGVDSLINSSTSPEKCSARGRILTCSKQLRCPKLFYSLVLKGLTNYGHYQSISIRAVATFMAQFPCWVRQLYTVESAYIDFPLMSTSTKIPELFSIIVCCAHILTHFRHSRRCWYIRIPLKVRQLCNINIPPSAIRRLALHRLAHKLVGGKDGTLFTV